MTNLDVTVDGNLTNITTPSMTDRLLTVQDSGDTLTDLMLGYFPWRNYVITPSVASNNLTVAIKGINGADAGSSNPLHFRVGDTNYWLAAAASFTLAAGTSWMNSGSSEIAAQVVNYFVYAIGESGAAAGLKFGISRFPGARLMSDFVNTSTNEKYIAGNWTTFTAADPVAIIGRFAATLSAGAGYTWSAPGSVINYPVYESDWQAWTPTITGYSANPTGAAYRYRVIYNTVDVLTNENTPGTGTAVNKTYTLPFTAKTITNMIFSGFISAPFDGGAFFAPGFVQASTTTMTCFKPAAAAWTAGSCRVPEVHLVYEI